MTTADHFNPFWGKNHWYFHRVHWCHSLFYRTELWLHYRAIICLLRIHWSIIWSCTWRVSWWSWPHRRVRRYRGSLHILALLCLYLHLIWIYIAHQVGIARNLWSSSSISGCRPRWWWTEAHIEPKEPLKWSQLLSRLHQYSNLSSNDLSEFHRNRT